MKRPGRTAWATALQVVYATAARFALGALTAFARKLLKMRANRSVLLEKI
jgi:hypothetical protein